MCYAAGTCMYSITWSIYFRWYHRYVGKFSSGSIRFLSVPCIFDIAVNKNHESTKPLFIMKINQINNIYESFAFYNDYKQDNSIISGNEKVIKRIIQAH